MANVVAICGSLRKGSFNRQLMNASMGLGPAGMTIKEAPSFATLPIYNFDDQHGSGFPAAVTTWADAVRSADGIIVVSPEYNWSIPGGLKNAIDWVSRMKNQPFAGQPIAVQSAAGGLMGGARMQYHLRQVLVSLNAFVLGGPEIFVSFAKTKVDEEKRELTDETTREFIRKQLAAFAAFIERVRPKS